LCNKALRYAPHRVDLLRKLGRFSASQGFLSDARRWFLEYAERAFHKGDVDDAFSALDDFADISDDAEIRELLARKMYAHGRFDEALHEYRRAYAMRLRDGATAEADSLRAEALERYPDLSDLAPETAVRQASWTDGAEALPQLDDKPATPEPPPAAEPPRTPPGLPGLGDDSADDAVRGAAPLAGFESTSLSAEETAIDDEAPADIEQTDGSGDSPYRSPHAPPPIPTQQAKASEGAAATDDYVDLSDLLGVSDQAEHATRFFVQETDPTGDEDRDFAELLSQFKQKIAENVAHDDIGSHYDLGLAFKEMGLLDEAISEFQVALRAGDDRLKIFEELGQCFLLKKQFNIAVKVLTRALQFEPDDEIELIGVYYHLGRAFEEIDDRTGALDAYERVVGLDINFKDVADRMARL
jgi:tetratricopeptide (TPR) repeat protein